MTPYLKSGFKVLGMAGKRVQLVNEKVGHQ